MSVDLAPGQTQRVEIRIGREDLALWHPALEKWVLEGGDYTIEVGASSRDLRRAAVVQLDGDDLALPLGPGSTLQEWLDHPTGGPALGRLLETAAAEGNRRAAMLIDPEGRSLVGSFPLNRLAAFPGSPLTREAVEELLAAVGDGR